MRSMRRRVAAVFVAVVAAFLVLDVIVLFSLWPQVHRSEVLSTRRAEGTRLLSAMASDLDAIGMAAAARFVEARAPDRDKHHVSTSGGEFETALRHFERVSREYEATITEPAQAFQWRRFTSETFPAFLSTARELMRAPASGGEGDEEKLLELRRTIRDAEAHLQQLAALNAQRLVDEATDLHDSVHDLALLCIGVGAIGIVCGFLLVRWALRAVREYERSMQERLDELDGFAGRVAHDLRNPLQTIAIALAVIRQRTGDERTLATCGKAQDSLKRTSQFIQELLAFARSGARPAPDARANVREVLARVETDLAASAEQRSVKLRVYDPPDVWVAIGPEALHAVVSNLADNAIKYMPRDRPDPLVEIVTRLARGEVELHVRDNGAGIAAEALPHLFDGFYRATDLAGGFGIGLATVKRLVEAHGGRTLVASEPGAGSHFTVILPVAAAPGASLLAPGGDVPPRESATGAFAQTPGERAPQ